MIYRTRDIGTASLQCGSAYAFSIHAFDEISFCTLHIRMDVHPYDTCNDASTMIFERTLYRTHHRYDSAPCCALSAHASSNVIVQKMTWCIPGNDTAPRLHAQS